MLEVETKDIRFNVLTSCEDCEKITAKRKYLQVALRKEGFKIVLEGRSLLWKSRINELNDFKFEKLVKHRKTRLELVIRHRVFQDLEIKSNFSETQEFSGIICQLSLEAFQSKWYRTGSLSCWRQDGDILSTSTRQQFFFLQSPTQHLHYRRIVTGSILHTSTLNGHVTQQTFKKCKIVILAMHKPVRVRRVCCRRGSTNPKGRINYESRASSLKWSSSFNPGFNRVGSLFKTLTPFLKR